MDVRLGVGSLIRILFQNLRIFGKCLEGETFTVKVNTEKLQKYYY